MRLYVWKKGRRQEEGKETGRKMEEGKKNIRQKELLYHLHMMHS